jgi:uncharacterized membrane protein YhhN
MVLLIISFVSAILEWFSEHKKNQLGIYLTKPTMMLALIGWVLLMGGTSFPLMWFVIALVCCLLGDVFLMLPPGRFFLPGLVVFLVGHIFYIVGIGQILPPDDRYWLGVLIAALVIVLSLRVYLLLADGMQKTGNQRMKIPVAIYSVIISVMLHSALMTLLTQEWAFTPALWVSVGALLFYVSDIMNAWTRFVSPIENGRVKIMSTYHLAQVALAVGASLQFGL